MPAFKLFTVVNLVINSINNAKLTFNLESIALSTGPSCFSPASFLNIDFGIIVFPYINDQMKKNSF